jgi:hypothetical protein
VRVRIFRWRGEFVFGDVAGVDGALGGEQEEILDDGRVLVAEIDGERGFSLVEMRHDDVDEFDFLLGLLVAALGFFLAGLRRFSSAAMSARINSELMISMSRIGSTVPSSWMMSSFSKQRTTWTMASVSRMLARNWLPRPAPSEAPLTRPAMSTNSMAVGTSFCEPEIFESTASRESGTVTMPTFGSMVQNG